MASAVPIWKGSVGPTEQLGSPAWDFQDRVTVTRRFRGTYAAVSAARPPNGAFGLGIYLGLRVTKSTLAPVDRGGIWEMAFTMEGLPPTEPLPPDDAGITYTQQEFALEKHPRYSSLSDATREKVKSYLNAADPDQRGKIYDSIPVGLAQELAGKLLAGQTHFTLYPPVYRWVMHSYLPPADDAGGYIQNPFGPIGFPSGYEWLRQGDDLQWTGNFWQLTRSWQSAYDWDADIYPV